MFTMQCSTYKVLWKMFLQFIHSNWLLTLIRDTKASSASKWDICIVCAHFVLIVCDDVSLCSAVFAPQFDLHPNGRSLGDGRPEGVLVSAFSWSMTLLCCMELSCCRGHRSGSALVRDECTPVCAVDYGSPGGKNHFNAQLVTQLCAASAHTVLCCIHTRV